MSCNRWFQCHAIGGFNVMQLVVSMPCNWWFQCHAIGGFNVMACNRWFQCHTIMVVSMPSIKPVMGGKMKGGFNAMQLVVSMPCNSSSKTLFSPIGRRQVHNKGNSCFYGDVGLSIIKPLSLSLSLLLGCLG